MNTVFPRILCFSNDMTVIDMKKIFFNLIKHIYSDLGHMKSDEDIHNNIFILVVNNLPKEKLSRYTERQVTCDLCGERHPQESTCEPIINKMKINSDNAVGIKLGDILDSLKHKRDIGFAFVFKAGSGACLKDLELEVENVRSE